MDISVRFSLVSLWGHYLPASSPCRRREKKKADGLDGEAATGEGGQGESGLELDLPARRLGFGHLQPSASTPHPLVLLVPGMSQSQYYDPNGRALATSSPSLAYPGIPQPTSSSPPSPPQPPHHSHSSGSASSFQHSWSQSNLGQAVLEAEAWRKRKVEDEGQGDVPSKGSRRSSMDLPSHQPSAQQTQQQAAKTVASCKECRRLSKSIKAGPEERKERRERRFSSSSSSSELTHSIPRADGHLSTSFLPSVSQRSNATECSPVRTVGSADSSREFLGIFFLFVRWAVSGCWAERIRADLYFHTSHSARIW